MRVIIPPTLGDEPLVSSQTPVSIEPEPQRETHLLEYVEVFRNRLALILAIFLKKEDKSTATQV